MRRILSLALLAAFIVAAKMPASLVTTGKAGATGVRQGRGSGMAAHAARRGR